MQLDINSEIYPMEKFKVFGLLWKNIRIFLKEYTVIITKSITGDETEEKGYIYRNFDGKSENLRTK